MAAKLFPKRIFLKRELGVPDPYYTATPDVTDLAERGERVKVGVYELVETQELTLSVAARKLD